MKPVKERDRDAQDTDVPPVPPPKELVLLLLLPPPKREVPVDDCPNGLELVFELEPKPGRADIELDMFRIFGDIRNRNAVQNPKIHCVAVKANESHTYRLTCYCCCWLRSRQRSNCCSTQSRSRRHSQTTSWSSLRSRGSVRSTDLYECAVRCCWC